MRSFADFANRHGIADRACTGCRVTRLELVAPEDGCRVDGNSRARGRKDGDTPSTTGAVRAADAAAAANAAGRVESRGDGLAAASAASAPLPKLPAAALGNLAAAASRRATVLRSSFDAAGAATSSSSAPIRDGKPQQVREQELLQQPPPPQQPRGRWLVTYVDMTWGTTCRMFADVVIVATGAPRLSLTLAEAAQPSASSGAGGGGRGGGGGGSSSNVWDAPAALAASGSADVACGVNARPGPGLAAAAAGGRSANGTSSIAAAGTQGQCQPARQVTTDDLQRAAKVTVVGQGRCCKENRLRALASSCCAGRARRALHLR